MSARRRRRSFAEKEAPHADERWMASYMDMVTVLMCMFIVLFAMSTVDQEKFEQLRSSLATGFGVTASEITDTAEGVVVPPDLVDEEGESFTDIELARIEVDNLLALKERISTDLEAVGLAQRVLFEIDERGLTIRLVSTETFFETNSDRMTADVVRVLDTIAPSLAAASYDLSVEGHADFREPVAPFPTNWELSSGRAVQVVRHLVEHGSIAAPRIASVGYGSAQPIAAGATPEELALNRRVDVVALSGQPEAIRALIPRVLDELEQGTAPPAEAPADVP